MECEKTSRKKNISYIIKGYKEEPSKWIAAAFTIIIMTTDWSDMTVENKSFFLYGDVR